LLSIFPAGIEIAGMPVIFARAVRMSYEYISLSEIDSPILWGVRGTVGIIIASTSWNIFSNCCLMKFLAFSASL